MNKLIMLSLLVSLESTAMTKKEFEDTVFETVSFIMFDKACDPDVTGEKIPDSCLDALDLWITEKTRTMK